MQGLKPPFDFIVSNPPYVGESEEEQVQLEVRKFEPRGAVFAGQTGIEVIARLIPQAREALRPGGWLDLEISGTIASQVERLLEWMGGSAHNPRSAVDRASCAGAKAAQLIRSRRRKLCRQALFRGVQNPAVIAFRPDCCFVLT